MRLMVPTMMSALLTLSACDKPAPVAKREPITVRSAGQDRLRALGALDRAIALKRAIMASGSSCKRVASSGFVGPYKNMDMWTARCEGGASAARDWAVFVGADDSVQVRLCKDTAAVGLPACVAQPGTAGGSGVTKKRAG